MLQICFALTVVVRGSNKRQERLPIFFTVNFNRVAKIFKSVKYAEYAFKGLIANDLAAKMNEAPAAWKTKYGDSLADFYLILYLDNMLNATGLFYDCTHLEHVTLDISNEAFPTYDKTLKADYMFYNCPNLLNLNFRNNIFINMISATSIFGKCIGPSSTANTRMNDKDKSFANQVLMFIAVDVFGNNLPASQKTLNNLFEIHSSNTATFEQDVQELSSYQLFASKTDWSIF